MGWLKIKWESDNKKYHGEEVWEMPGSLAADIFTALSKLIYTIRQTREIEIYDLKVELAIKMNLLAEYKALIDKHLEQTIKEKEGEDAHQGL